MREAIYRECKNVNTDNDNKIMMMVIKTLIANTVFTNHALIIFTVYKNLLAD